MFGRPLNLVVGEEAEAAKRESDRQQTVTIIPPVTGNNGDQGEILDLRVRIVGGDDTSVKVGEKEQVHALKQQVLDCKGTPGQPISALRLFFYGKELKYSATLKDIAGVESGVTFIGQL